MLDRSQRELFADKLMDLGNLSIAGLVFGQMIEGKLAWSGYVVGITLYLALLIFSYFLQKGPTND